jgi:hypothetical protein
MKLTLNIAIGLQMVVVPFDYKIAPYYEAASELCDIR